MDIEINKMRTFKQNNPEIASNKDVAKEKWKEILQFVFEAVMAFLPLLIVWMITQMIADSSFPFEKLIMDGELLWFSITVLAALNLSLLFSGQRRFVWKVIGCFTLFLSLFFNGVYIFLKLVGLEIVSLTVKPAVVIWCVVLCTALTVFARILIIVSKRWSDEK